MKYRIRWVNRWNKELAWVSAVRLSKGYFETTGTPEQAKTYASPKTVQKELDRLEEFYEGTNHIFHVECI